MFLGIDNSWFGLEHWSTWSVHETSAAHTLISAMSSTRLRLPKDCFQPNQQIIRDYHGNLVESKKFGVLAAREDWVTFHVSDLPEPS